MVVLLLLVACGQRVDLGVVEQGPGAISPREALVADPHVVVGHELSTGLAVVSLVTQVGVHHAQGHRGNGHKVGQLLPQLVSTA